MAIRLFSTRLSNLLHSKKWPHLKVFKQRSLCIDWRLTLNHGGWLGEAQAREDRGFSSWGSNYKPTLDLNCMGFSLGDSVLATTSPSGVVNVTCRFSKLYPNLIWVPLENWTAMMLRLKINFLDILYDLTKNWTQWLNLLNPKWMLNQEIILD